MTEIERIIVEFMRELEIKEWGFTEHQQSKLAKAIEQYLLDLDFCNHCVAELKKGLDNGE